MRQLLTFVCSLLAVFPVATPLRAAAVPEAAPSCAPPALPDPIATRYVELGASLRFGCFVGMTNAGEAVFANGRIVRIATYGPKATYAFVIDPADAQHVVHVYLSGATFDEDVWLVRLTVNGTFINQVRYPAGQGDVGGTYASDISVHPGGRHGKFEVAMEGCAENALHPSSCVGWSAATFRFDL